MVVHHVNWLLAWMCNVLWRNEEDGGEPVFLLTQAEANGRLTLSNNTFDLLEVLSVSCQSAVRGPPWEQTESRKWLPTVSLMLFEFLL